MEDYRFKALKYLAERRFHNTAHTSERKHKSLPRSESRLQFGDDGLCSRQLGEKEWL